MQLVLDPRFSGLFWTQLLGAFNDNFFKNALLIMVVFKGLSFWGLSEQQLSIAAAGLFILPFFLFSATAGQLSDKWDKAVMIRRVKWVEAILAGIAVLGFATESLELLFVVLMLLGLQSAFFGPLKYGILPQLLSDEELVAGNALVETGTKLAILIGTILGGILAARENGTLFICLIMCLVAAGGIWSAQRVPSVRAADPDLKVEWNPITPTWRVMKVTRANRAVFLSILGISWFWLLGGAFVTLFPNYGKDVLSVDPDVVTMFSATFSIGVAIGALLCNKFSFHRLELGLVPFGSIGITLFTADLAWIGNPLTVEAGHFLTPLEFLSQFGGLRITFDLLGLAIFSGFFIIPLYTMIQQRTEEKIRARVIAGNNVMNALFMVLSSVMLYVLTDQGFTIPQMFAILSVVNGLVAIYIYGLIPEFFLRFVVYLMTHIIYRLQVLNDKRLPAEGGAVLVANHVSWIDWLVVAAAVPRPVRFVMWYAYFNAPFIRFLFRDARVIPIAPAKISPEILEAAYDQIAEELESGALVCIFPEGVISADGEMSDFKQGVERIVKRTPVPVIPLGLQGLWGSFFSNHPGSSTIFHLLFREFRDRLWVVVGEPVPAQEVQAEKLRGTIVELLDEDVRT